VNKDGERFMRVMRLPPKTWPAATWCRARWQTEIKEGRGCGPHADHVLLSWIIWATMYSSPPARYSRHRPQFAHVDPSKARSLLVPTAHYMMVVYRPTIAGKSWHLAERLLTMWCRVSMR